MSIKIFFWLTIGRRPRILEGIGGVAMAKEEILALLQSSRPHYRSGEEMSRALGISRAAVWKAVEGLREEGYQISSAPNRGYCLESGPDRVRAGSLSAQLAGGRIGAQVVCLDQVDSTNNEVKRRRADGAPEGLVVIAEEQTGGRGRRGRSFQSLKGKGLYCSVLLRPQVSLSQVPQLTAWTAVAVCRGIEAACGLKTGIKWTNDIISGGKKLCGILTELELEGESGALGGVVVGFGINVSQTRSDFGPQLEEVATSLLEETGRPVRRDQLALAVLQALEQMLRDFPREAEPYWQEYRTRCVTLGRQVKLLTPGGERQAFARDLDRSFGLMVDYPDGSGEVLTSGEVSVRGITGYSW
jgi:BirA family biotin operon repressor/biotin-[acetyl-CoA-carboxylase] ligase